MSAIRLLDPFRPRVVSLFFALALAPLGIAQNTPQQSPPPQQPGQQQPDQTSPDSGGPGGENGPIALPKKKDKPEEAPPPAPAQPKF